jgi:Na+/H+-dicarboxylate symporter
VKRLRSRQVSLGVVVWIVVGLLVASTHHFLEHLDTLSRVLSAVLAVMVWPLVLLHVHFGV